MHPSPEPKLTRWNAQVGAILNNQLPKVADELLHTYQLRHVAHRLAEWGLLDGHRGLCEEIDAGFFEVQQRYEDLHRLNLLVRYLPEGGGDAPSLVTEPEPPRPPSEGSARWSGLDLEGEIAPLAGELECCRDTTSTAAAAAETDLWGQLTPELDQMLAAVVEQTRGKKALIVGGRRSELARERIQVFMEFARVEWPDQEPDDSLEPLFRRLNQVDHLLVTRFCRKRTKQLIREARARALPVVYLPHGYSLNQVIYQSYQQLFRRA
jgi:hypothetical protein